MKRLTKEQFINQFPYKCNIDGAGIEPMFDGTFEGVEVYRLLNLLIIKLDGEYYCRGN